MSSLTDKFIAESYTGLLHSNGQPLPASGQETIYDGYGNSSSITLGQTGNGAKITGSLVVTDTLTIGSEIYPSVPGPLGSFLCQTDTNTLGFVSNISTNIVLDDLSPSPAGTYEKISTVTVNSKGQVTNVTVINEPVLPSDPATITSTTYIPNASSPYQTLSLGDSWTQVFLPTSWPTDTKAIIGFIRPTDDAKVGSYFTLFGSPDSGVSMSFPLLQITGGESGSDTQWGGGGQFQTRIGKTASGAPVVYLKATPKSTGRTFNFHFHIIAYQR